MRELNFELVHVESELSQHWLQHTPKKLGQRHVYHCVISPFLVELVLQNICPILSETRQPMSVVIIA